MKFLDQAKIYIASGHGGSALYPLEERLTSLLVVLTEGMVDVEAT